MARTFNNYMQIANRQKNKAAINALKSMQGYTKDYTPYVCNLWAITLEENTDLSPEDIDHLLDCFQEVALRGYEKQEARKIVNERLGLDLYAEPDKAKAGK